MTINWASTQVYNTIMCIATGVGILLILKLLTSLRRGKVRELEGWSMGFGVLGFILTLTGAHMTLTWPLAEIGFPFDDIIFGEPSLAFGVLLLGVAVLLWRKSSQYRLEGLDLKDPRVISERLLSDMPHLFKPMSYFGAAMGYALIAIGIAGVTYQLFAAPPQEPISGAFAEYPMVEATFISALYAITGIGAAMFPFLMKEKRNHSLDRAMFLLWRIAGIIFIGFGVMNYFTHIGLIVNTM